jgi:tRNA 5-methylaminomethyl-2-thiouridine biosynthesis bifunctional protein
MAEPLQWLPDGTPYSPRFEDRYRSEAGGLAQAHQVFFQGCGLPEAWAGQAQWRMLETGFGLGLNFLVTWQAWRADPLRPKILHFVATEAYPVSASDLLQASQAHPPLQALAEQLSQRFEGLLPGVHRLVFESGRVLLSLCIGETRQQLREQNFEADSIFLDGFSPRRNPDMWDAQTLKAVARCARRGTRLATWSVARSVIDGLRQAGFAVSKTAGVAPKRDNLQATFDPHWEPKTTRTPARAAAAAPGRCIVIGAGLAGAACASSLARRGWQVTVLDAHDTPAGGASSLPAGVIAPHVSPDDSVLSRLSRSGLRATWQEVVARLQPDIDWQSSGVLQRRFDTSSQLPPDWPAAGHHWSRLAGAEQAAALHVAEADALPPALWHAAGGWIKPARLVQALLQQASITTRLGVQVSHLQRIRPDVWQARNAAGDCLAEAELVVLAAGVHSAALKASADAAMGIANASGLALQAIRGQVTWGELGETANTGAGHGLAHFPVNGHGSFIPDFNSANGRSWLMGASFDRNSSSADVLPQDRQDNLARLRTLLPGAAKSLGLDAGNTQVRDWAGVRCVSPDRLPLVGPVAPEQLPGLWVCTGLGSRGLTFAVLCAELLTAWLHAEPLPLPNRLAQALRAERIFKKIRPAAHQ